MQTVATHAVPLHAGTTSAYCQVCSCTDTQLLLKPLCITTVMEDSCLMYSGCRQGLGVTGAIAALGLAVLVDPNTLAAVCTVLQQAAHARHG